MFDLSLRALAIGCGLLLMVAAANAAGLDKPQAVKRGVAEPPASASGMAPQVDAELIALLDREGRRQLSKHLQERGRFQSVDVRVSIDAVKGILTVDFGQGFLPGPDEGYAEMFLYSLGPTLRHYVEQAGIPISEIRFLFRGKPIQHYFPEDQAVPAPVRQAKDTKTALISSSHGLVRVFPSATWEFQRPELFGFREDFITPAFGDELQSLLEQRSDVTTHRARSRSIDPHPESHREWELMSSRYHLKALLPDRTDIWNELSNSTENDREVSEDVRARPNYANHLGVGVLISLHTNGSDDGGVRGTEVYYHEDKPNDRPLADRVLCGMRELIRAQPGYESFPVREQPSAARHGENRIGTMPSVIAEIAYHSNAEDSAALQDPIFRAASMKGVEKGYRLWANEKPCTAFELGAIADTQMPPLSSVDVPVPFTGNPQFPVIAELTVAGCDEEGACEPYRQTLEEAESPLMLRLACNGTGHGTAAWSTVLRDADGVTTNSVKHLQICGNG